MVDAYYNILLLQYITKKLSLMLLGYNFRNMNYDISILPYTVVSSNYSSYYSG